MKTKFKNTKWDIRVNESCAKNKLRHETAGLGQAIRSVTRDWQLRMYVKLDRPSVCQHHLVPESAGTGFARLKPVATQTRRQRFAIMKSPEHFFAARFALALLGLALAGCQTHKAVIPLSHGYQEVSHPHHAWLDEPEPPRISFEHLETDGKTTVIWPSVYGANEIIKGDLAIFVGERGYIDEGARVTHPRLFAVQSPALPLDITDVVLWRWAKANGKDFAKALDKLNLVTPAENTGGLEVELEFSVANKLFGDEQDWPDKGTLQLNWNQVAEILRAVKTKGVQQTDLRWHTPFIGERF